MKNPYTPMTNREYEMLKEMDYCEIDRNLDERKLSWHERDPILCDLLKLAIERRDWAGVSAAAEHLSIVDANIEEERRLAETPCDCLVCQIKQRLRETPSAEQIRNPS